MKNGVSILLATMVAVLAGCQVKPKVPEQAGAAISGDVRDALADLARGHEQKIELAFWVSTPLKPVEKPFQGFYQKLGTDHQALLDELKKWAADRHVDLTYHEAPGVAGEAQKLTEGRQEALVRGDGQADFERDNLMQMLTDHDWELSEVQVLLKTAGGAEDAGLKAYLEKCQKVLESERGEILDLLRRYKFAG